MTGAAFTRFFVKTPAYAHGFSDAIIVKSLFFFLIPEKMDAPLNPIGAVIPCDNHSIIIAPLTLSDFLLLYIYYYNYATYFFVKSYCIYDIIVKKIISKIKCNGRGATMLEYLQILTINYSTFILINLLLSAIVILLERKNSTAALAWLFFLNLFPGFGFFFYILLSQNISKRKIFRYTKEESLLYSSILSEQREAILTDRIHFVNNILPQYKDMILFHNKLSQSLLTQNNTVKIFTEGTDKFESLLQDIQNATDHIHLLYYIVSDDEIGNRFFDLLKIKASQGVQVRFLIDHVGGRELKNKTVKSLRQSGIKVYFFFPSRFKYFNLKGNYRNHRKLAIIDGKIGYIGGFNIGDEYMGKSPKFGHWRDTHLRLTGNCVSSLQIRFYLDWRNASKEFLSATNLSITSGQLKALTPTSDLLDYHLYNEEIGNTAIQIVDSGPDSINEQIKQGYLQIINKAKKYIYIQSPYFIPDESINEALKIAASSGVDVRIMIPNKPDHPFVYWATYSYAGDLLPYGVKLYIYENGFLHSKTIVSDDSVSSVGSCNFDIRSFKLNFEVNAFLYSESESVQLRKAFESDQHYCHECTLRRYQKRGFVIKGKESISRLFSSVL